MLRLLGFRSMVLIEDKGFENLSPDEVAEMIDVHLGRSGRFDPDALYEFLSMKYEGFVESVRSEIEDIDKDFASSATHIDGIDTSNGRAALADLASRLRHKS